jgi:tRNA (cmo5U34)-methyltransferase
LDTFPDYQLVLIARYWPDPAAVHFGLSESTQKKDDIFAPAESPPHDFVFDERVAAVFDDMLARSIPFYGEQQRMICRIAGKYYVPGTRIYDLGCSTGFTLAGLAEEIGPPAQLVGIDNSEPMLDRARERLAGRGLQDRITLVTGDLDAGIADLRIENASVVTLCWTLQFVRPLNRDALIRSIHHGMTANGVVIVAEKILVSEGAVNRFFIDEYYEFKNQNGYSRTEIARKREALENVLVPYRRDENIELFRRNGFGTVETFFQWYNFAAFLCVKTA